MKFVFDAGHWVNTAGKRPPDDSMREFHFNSAVVNYMIEGMKDYEDAEILTTHANDRDVPLSERVEAAKSWDSDVLVSVHANAHSDPKSKDGWSNAHGIETFTYVNPSRASVALAVSIQRNLISATGLEDRGVKNNTFKILSGEKVGITSVLAECGFMTNKKELALLKSDEYRRKCANAIVKSLAEVYGLKKKPNSVKMATKVQIPTIQRALEVSVNGKPNTTGYLIDNVTYVPIRMIAETFGANVDWNDGNPVKITKEV